jgi:hypothetical protein
MLLMRLVLLLKKTKKKTKNKNKNRSNLGYFEVRNDKVIVAFSKVYLMKQSIISMLNYNQNANKNSNNRL